MNPFILPVMSLIISLLLFFEDGFGSKWHTKVDIPLKKENDGILLL